MREFFNVSCLSGPSLKMKQQHDLMWKQYGCSRYVTCYVYQRQIVGSRVLYHQETMPSGGRSCSAAHLGIVTVFEAWLQPGWHPLQSLHLTRQKYVHAIPSNSSAGCAKCRNIADEGTQNCRLRANAVKQCQPFRYAHILPLLLQQ